MLEKPPHSPIEAPVRAPSERTPSPKPDLMASLIVLFISAAINIFVFGFSSQYLGKENFQRLPDWIIGTYRGVWSSVAVGGAGIGLAIVELSRTDENQAPIIFSISESQALRFYYPLQYS